MDKAILIFFNFTFCFIIGFGLGYIMSSGRVRAELIKANNFLVLGRLNLNSVLNETISETVRIQLAKANGTIYGALDCINIALRKINDKKECSCKK